MPQLPGSRTTEPFARHFPVMLAESLEYLAIKPDGRYLDCTAGLGGHTAAIAALLDRGGRGCRLLTFSFDTGWTC